MPQHPGCRSEARQTLAACELFRSGATHTHTRTEKDADRHARALSRDGAPASNPCLFPSRPRRCGDYPASHHSPPSPPLEPIRTVRSRGGWQSSRDKDQECACVCVCVCLCTLFKTYIPALCSAAAGAESHLSSSLLSSPLLSCSLVCPSPHTRTNTQSFPLILLLRTQRLRSARTPEAPSGPRSC